MIDDNILRNIQIDTDYLKTKTENMRRSLKDNELTDSDITEFKECLEETLKELSVELSQLEEEEDDE